MKIAPFLKEYIRLIGDEYAKIEIEELAAEYNIRKNLTDNTVESTIELRKEFMEKARKIARPWVKDKTAFEKIIWRQNNELTQQNSVPSVE